MFPSYGGTGYLRSSTRRRKTREELIAEQEARNQAMLGMPPGSAWDRVGPDIDPRMRASSRSPVVQLRGRPLPPEPVTQLSTPMAFPPLEEGFVREQPNYPAVMPPTLPDFSTMLPSSVKRAEAQPALSSSIPGALESGQAVDAPEQSSFFGNMFKQDENGSNPLSLALLSAGLGILANNYGHYGQAGPAIGKGALQGLQTYLGERERSDRLTREKKEAQRAQAREAAYLRQVSAQEMRARNEDAADTRMQARRRLLLEMPAGPQRDRLLEMDMVESGQYPQYLKAEKSTAAGEKPVYKVLGVGQDEKGNDLVQQHQVFPDGTLKPLGTPTKKTAGQSISIDMAGEKKESQDEGARRVEEAKGYFTAADLARTQRQDILLLKGLDVKTGPTAILEKGLGSIASVFEIPSEKMANYIKQGMADVILQNQVLTKQMELKGATSNADMIRVENTAAKTTDPQEKWNLWLDVRLAQLDMIEERANFYEDWRDENNNSYAGARKAWREYSKNKSIWDHPVMQKWSKKVGGSPAGNSATSKNSPWSEGWQWPKR